MPKEPLNTGFVCTGCGQPSPPALPGMNGRIFCDRVHEWVPVASTVCSCYHAPEQHRLLSDGGGCLVLPLMAPACDCKYGRPT
jgi:hypothetical protein